MKHSIKSAKRKAWELLSKIIRLSAADKNDHVRCVSCGKRLHWQAAHCGHFIPKKRGTAVYFARPNLAPQCPHCNLFLEGNTVEFYAWMLKNRGQKVIDELRALSRTTLKLKLHDYDGMIEDYQEELAWLEESRK